MLIMFGKFVVLTLTGGLAAAIGGLADLVTGQSVAAIVSGAWLSVLVMAAGMVPLMEWAYGRYDPSGDTPPQGLIWLMSRV